VQVEAEPNTKFDRVHVRALWIRVVIEKRRGGSWFGFGSWERGTEESHGYIMVGLGGGIGPFLLEVA
jgi:hypothetical protein